MNRTIHFAHGNGFPSPCYKQLFDGLGNNFSISYIDMLGHNPNYPITENWQFLVDELIENITRNHQQPVIGMGHSLGGVLTLLASFKRPDCFQSIVLFDAPMFGVRKSSLIKLIKTFGLIDQVTPASRIEKRLDKWESRESLKQYLTTKKLYKNFDPLCIEDYIDNALYQDENGHYCLRYDKKREGQIYRTVPHNMPKQYCQQNLPVILIYGESSDIIGKLDLRVMKAKYRFKTYACKGGHMFPFEQPRLAADLISQALAE